MTVSETSLVQKNCPISELVRQKITQLLLKREALSHIAEKLAISTSTVYRKLKQFQSKDDYSTLPKVLSWDEFSYQKNKLAFIAQDYETKKIVTIDMSGNDIPLIKMLFPNAKIVLDRFHIVQHMNRALKQTRTQIMKQFEKKSLEYRALKYYWKLIQLDSRKLSPNTFYSRTFRETLTLKECLEKIFKLVPQLKHYYNLYQLLLFHLQEKNTERFFGLIQDVLPQLNHYFKTALTTFCRYQKYITNAIELPYSNAKLEATNKLIKDIKRNAFGYRNFDNFKKRIYLALNCKKARTTVVLART